MEEEQIIEMMTRINDYIQYRLNHLEEDHLWVEFKKDPHWFTMFQTELNLTHLFKHADKVIQP